MSTKLKLFWSRAWKTLAFPAIICVLFAILTKGQIFTRRSILIFLRQSVLPALIIMAMLPNLSLGLMDFSMGSVVMTSAIVGGTLMNLTGTGILGLVLFSLLSAMLMTTFTGFLNNKLKIPFIIISLGLTLIYEQLPRLIFSFQNAAIIKVKYAMLAQAPLIFIVFGVAFFVFFVANNYTTFGHNIKALGGNDELAERAGLNTARIKQMSFILAGFFAGLAGAVYMASNGQVDYPAQFNSMTTVMDAFLGLFLGMFLGKYCDISIGLVIAVITMQIMSNGLVTLGCDSTWRDIFKALFLLVLLIFSGNQPYFTKWRQDMNRAKIANDDYERRVQQG